MLLLKKIIMIFCILALFCAKAPAQDGQKPQKIKFYNFDDLLIDGKIKKPQVLYTDARQKVKFERLLKLKKDFIPKLKDTRKDPTLK